MAKDKNALYDVDSTASIPISVADNSEIISEGVGKIDLRLNNENIETATNVLYVPNLSTNLLSVKKMTEKGYSVVFDKKPCKVYDASSFQASGDIEFVCPK